MAAALESCNRQVCMGVRRSENMNYIDSLFHHSFHRGEDFRDAEPSSQTCCARVHNVGDSYDSCVGHSLDSASVKLANVACSNQSDPEMCIWRHSGFLSTLLGVAIKLFHLSQCPSRTLTAG